MKWTGRASNHLCVLASGGEDGRIRHRLASAYPGVVVDGDELPVIRALPSPIDTMWLWRYAVRWDSGFYLDIARNGHHYEPGHCSSIAYFPLYPLFIRYVHLLLPKIAVFSSLVVPQLALTTVTIYFFRTAGVDFGRRVAWRAVFLLLVFPTALIFSAVYPEGLLVLMLVGSLYHAR